MWRAAITQRIFVGVLRLIAVIWDSGSTSYLCLCGWVTSSRFRWWDLCAMCMACEDFKLMKGMKTLRGWTWRRSWSRYESNHFESDSGWCFSVTYAYHSCYIRGSVTGRLHGWVIETCEDLLNREVIMMHSYTVYSAFYRPSVFMLTRVWHLLSFAIHEPRDQQHVGCSPSTSTPHQQVLVTQTFLLLTRKRVQISDKSSAALTQTLFGVTGPSLDPGKPLDDVTCIIRHSLPRRCPHRRLL